EVLARELLRIVELVIVDEVAEAGDGARDALRRRLAGVLRLVAAGHEPRHHRPEGPDTEGCLHALLLSSSGLSLGAFLPAAAGGGAGTRVARPLERAGDARSRGERDEEDAGEGVARAERHAPLDRGGATSFAARRRRR